MVDKFESNGLTLDKYLPACVKTPQLFTLSPETISTHIDILRFSKFNTGEEIDNEEFFDEILHNPMVLSFSTSLLLIKNLIIPKMFENSRVPLCLKGSHQREKLNAYLKSNPDKKYEINVKNIASKADCVELLKETLSKISTDALNRDDVFEVNVEN